MCVEVGRVRVDEARDNQNKTLQHDFWLGNLYCVLLDNHSKSECQTRIKALTSLILIAPGKNIQQGFSSAD